MATRYPRAKVVLTLLVEDFAAGAAGPTLTIEATPRSVEWHRNTYREADTFTIELDWRDLPLDTRLVKSCLVAIFCGDAGDALLDVRLYDPTHQVFLGYVDEPQAAFSDTGERLTLKGRDYTAFFLDSTWTGGALDLRLPLSAIVALVVAGTPGALGMAVAFGPFAASAAGVPLSVAVGRSKWSPQPGDDAWTVLSSVCNLAGLVPVVSGSILYIRAAGDVGLLLGSLTWGENLHSLTLTRNLQEWRSKQVEVRCWNPTLRTTLSGVYPPVPLVVGKKLGASGPATEAGIQTFFIEGAHTPPQLLSLAQAIYQREARDQLKGELETSEMVDPLTMAPLTLLANGDRVMVRWGVQLLSLIEGLTPPEALAALVVAGLDPVVASTLVAGATAADGLASTFYVKAARHKWSRDEGYRLVVEFENLVGAGGIS